MLPHLGQAEAHFIEDEGVGGVLELVELRGNVSYGFFGGGEALRGGRASWGLQACYATRACSIAGCFALQPCGVVASWHRGIVAWRLCELPRR